VCGIPIKPILASYWTTIRAAYVLPSGECMGLNPDSARAALGRLPAALSSVAMAYSAGSGTIRIPLLFPVLRRFVYLERGCGPGGRG